VITSYTASTGLELITYLRMQELEREWKMRALAAQLPRKAHPSLRDLLVRGLRALAMLLDPTTITLSTARDPS
jgi:hypothetical protein